MAGDQKETTSMIIRCAEDTFISILNSPYIFPIKMDNKDLEKLIELRQWFFWKRKPPIYYPMEGHLALRQSLVEAVLITPKGQHFVELLHAMGETMRAQTESLGYIIYLKEKISNDIFICPKESKYFFDERHSWDITICNTIATYAIRNKEACIVNTSTTDMRFPEFQDILELDSSNVLTVPILDSNENCHGALELYRENGIRYDFSHLQRVQYFLKWVGEGMYFNEEQVHYEKFVLINEYCMKKLSDYFGKPFEKFVDYYLFKIASLTKNVLDAESATIFLKNKNDLLRKEMTTDLELSDKKIKEKLRVGKELQIANVVLESDDLINFKDVVNDHRFDTEIDVKTGKIIRTVLSAKIRGKKHTFGVLQLFNKLKNDVFPKDHESYIQDFSKYCAFWLYYRNNSEKLINQKLLNQIIEDMICAQLIDTWTISDSFTIEEKIYIPQEFSSFEFFADHQYISELTKFIFYIFMNMCGSLLIQHSKELFNFIAMVKKLYSKAKFYNFQHAFTTLHMVYCLLKLYPKLFSPLQVFALLVSAFCTEINSTVEIVGYLAATNSPIVQLYEKSFTENHKVWLIKFVVKESNLIKHLEIDDRTKILNSIEENILSLDMRKHIVDRFELKNLFNTHNTRLDSMNESEKYLLRSLIMYAAKTSFIVKSLPIADTLLSNFIHEFTTHITAIRSVMGDTDDKDIDDNTYFETKLIEHKKLCCEIIKIIYIPCFELMKNIFPHTEIMYKRCLEFYKFFSI